MKSYFTWYERLFIWFRKLLGKEHILAEVPMMEATTERIKHYSGEFVKTINESLLKDQGVKMKLIPISHTKEQGDDINGRKI